MIDVDRPEWMLRFNNLRLTLFQSHLHFAKRTCWPLDGFNFHEISQVQLECFKVSGIRQFGATSSDFTPSTVVLGLSLKFVHVVFSFRLNGVSMGLANDVAMVILVTA